MWSKVKYHLIAKLPHAVLIAFAAFMCALCNCAVERTVVSTAHRVIDCVTGTPKHPICTLAQLVIKMGLASAREESPQPSDAPLWRAVLDAERPPGYTIHTEFGDI